MRLPHLKKKEKPITDKQMRKSLSEIVTNANLMTRNEFEKYLASVELARRRELWERFSPKDRYQMLKYLGKQKGETNGKKK